jgi:enoyl-[acyl-carrier protein] reductase II
MDKIDAGRRDYYRGVKIYSQIFRFLTIFLQGKSQMIIERFLKTGREFLGCKYPIMCGAMTWISDPQLVSAVGEAGGFGLIAGGNAPVAVMKDQIMETRKISQAPFGVNLITLAPVYNDQLDMVCDLGCEFVVFAGGIPRGTEIQQAKKSGAKVLCFAPTAPLAHMLIDRGTDALILEGSEAGGIATGRMMAHLLMMGAAGIQMGTRFVMAQECNAHPKFKEVFKKAKAKDATATPQFDSRLPVIPVRALKNEGTIEFGKLQLELLNKLDNQIIDREEAQFEVERFWVGALKDAAIDGNIASGSLMAGQSVGLVSEIKPLKGIIDEMVGDAENELRRLKDYLG